MIFTFWDITRKYHGSLRNIYCTTLYVTVNLKFLNFWSVFAELYHPCMTRWVSRKPEKSIPNPLFCDTKIVISLARTLGLSSWRSYVVFFTYFDWFLNIRYHSADAKIMFTIDVCSCTSNDRRFYLTVCPFRWRSKKTKNVMRSLVILSPMANVLLEVCWYHIWR